MSSRYTHYIAFKSSINKIISTVVGVCTIYTISNSKSRASSNFMWACWHGYNNTLFRYVVETYLNRVLLYPPCWHTHKSQLCCWSSNPRTSLWKLMWYATCTMSSIFILFYLLGKIKNNTLSITQRNGLQNYYKCDINSVVHR